MNRFDTHSNVNAFDDDMERLEIWTMTKQHTEYFNIVAHLLTFIGNEA